MFTCNNCAYKSKKWYGKCPSCDAWNSMSELQEGGVSTEKAGVKPAAIQHILDTITQDGDVRLYPFKSAQLNDFWSGGVTKSGFTLLAGEPGLGKSTFALQLLRSLYLHDSSLNLLYITAEESQQELARRAERLNIPTQISVLQTNVLTTIESTIQSHGADIVIIDSIQTLYDSAVSSSPGSISQVTHIASRLLSLCKTTGTSIILIGHVTKDGQIAGPKTLEHLVDSVMLLESTKQSLYRTVRFQKHRFGRTDSMLLLKMEETGLNIISDPSLALLENIENGPGVVYGLSLDGDLPMVVEVQSLVSGQDHSGFGRRESSGIPSSKLHTIIAIIEKYLNIPLRSYDIYVQIEGLPRKIYDPSLDLPVLLSIMSSLRGSAIGSSKTVYAGRLTLAGTLRKPTQEDIRLDSSKKLKFQFNPGISYGPIAQAVKEAITISK